MSKTGTYYIELREKLIEEDRQTIDDYDILYQEFLYEQEMSDLYELLEMEKLNEDFFQSTDINDDLPF